MPLSLSAASRSRLCHLRLQSEDPTVTRKKPLPLWVKLPNAWIEDNGLCDFRWGRGEGPNNIAALMVLTAISHHIDAVTGIARLTYDELCEMTSLSRATVSVPRIFDGLVLRIIDE